MFNEREKAMTTTKPTDQAFGDEGLTIREYFAALAMQGLWANSPQSPLHGQPEYDTVQIARMAVQAADDLIAELNKTA